MARTYISQYMISTKPAWQKPPCHPMKPHADVQVPQHSPDLKGRWHCYRPHARWLPDMRRRYWCWRPSSSCWPWRMQPPARVRNNVWHHESSGLPAAVQRRSARLPGPSLRRMPDSLAPVATLFKACPTNLSCAKHRLAGTLCTGPGPGRQFDKNGKIQKCPPGSAKKGPGDFR